MKAPVFTLVCMAIGVAACSSMEKVPPKRLIPMPKATVEAQPLCEQPTTPYQINAQSIKVGCYARLQRNAANQLLMNHNDGSTETLSINARVVQPNQWQQGQRPASFHELANVEHFTDWLAAGLRQLEGFGVLLQPKAVFAKSSGWQSTIYGELAWPQNIKQGSSYISRAAAPVLTGFTAGFDSPACSSQTTGGSFVGVAPYQFKTLVFDVNFARAVSHPLRPYVLKLWIDAEGNRNRSKLHLTQSDGCLRTKDNAFDATETAAYVLMIDGLLISSPIWYAPLKG